MKRSGLFVAVVGLLWSLIVVGVAQAHGPKLDWGPELSANNCDGQLVINVTQRITNDNDSGVAGNYWALDDYHRQIQVWQVGEDEFCVVVSYRGTFTSLDGASPNNTDIDGIAAGIIGKMDGGYRATLSETTLKDAPDLPTNGNLGTYDYKCDIDADCPGYVNVFDAYFDPYKFDYDWWGWMYHTAQNGTWINASTGNLGDITD